MIALLSTPLRRWLLASLLLPVVATILTKLGHYLQRRHGGEPTALSRVLLGLSSLARRFTRRHRPDADPAATQVQQTHAAQLP